MQNLTDPLVAKIRDAKHLPGIFSVRFWLDSFQEIVRCGHVLNFEAQHSALLEFASLDAPSERIL